MSEKPQLIALRKVDGSESVAKAGYNADTKTLAVEFTSGDTYHYQGVELGTYKSLLKARSFGKYLQSNVVGKYEHKKVIAGEQFK